MLIHLMSQSKNCVSALELHRQLKISYSTVLQMKHKVMQMMYMEDDKKIAAYVEIKEEHLELSPVEHGDKQQNNEEYRPFIAALETGAEGKALSINLAPVEHFDSRSMQKWLDRNICDGCQAQCDSKHCYQVMCESCRSKGIKLWPPEESKGKFSWMNIIVNNVKASIYGTYHSIDYKRYGYRYLADIQYRFNRRFDLKQMFYGLLSTAATKMPVVFDKPGIPEGKVEFVE